MYRRNEIYIAPYECSVFHYRAILAAAVIIYKDDSAAKIYTFADIGVSHICKVGGLGAVTELLVFDLNKVSDLAAAAHIAARPQICERSYRCFISHTAFQYH